MTDDELVIIREGPFSENLSLKASLTNYAHLCYKKCLLTNLQPGRLPFSQLANDSPAPQRPEFYAVYHFRLGIDSIDI